MCNASQEVSWCFSSSSSNTSGRQQVLYDATNRLRTNTRKGRDAFRGRIDTKVSMPCHITKEKYVLSTMHQVVRHLTSRPINAPQRENLCIVCHALGSDSNEKHLRSLDSYFGKLQNNANQPSSYSLNQESKKSELPNTSGQFRARKGLGALDDYLGKLNEDAKSKNYVPSASDDETTNAAPYPIKGNSGRGRVKKLKNYMELKNNDGESGPKSSEDETSNLYLISILASINIAVFLFEIASPIGSSDLELFSVPLVYGAKINHLILIGEWWRLVTPMFLHSGILHVAFGCWVLLTFGPQVCRAYGSLTFFLIYILGGISGNLTSFLHTPDPTVGGTGPVFAIIGAWLIYQIQNSDITGKDMPESMFQKAIIATALSCILSNFGPIDDWTHYGAAFMGIVYGFFTCPTLQMDDASSKTGQEEQITLVRRHVNPSSIGAQGGFDDECWHGMGRR
ncbi:unnamed protein product [Ilex paraguariensis]|uniref:Peptidase S54 rhomboid domain-containing protein n=1 Tax=Ilex paraguariensis TaxID=185542 RepID=A0ABC8RFY9_9AQUA